MRYTTVLVDFHNTFTNNRARLVWALNEGFKQVLGYNVPAQIVRGALSRDKSERLVDFLRNRCGIPANRLDRFQAVQEAAMNDIYIPQYGFVLKRLKESGVTTAVVTNSESRLVRQQIKKWGWDKHLAEVFSGGGDGNLTNIARKPYPDRINFALKVLRERGHHVLKEQTLMVGDHLVDIQAARSASIDSAYLVTGTEQVDANHLPIKPTHILYEVHGTRLSPNLRDLPAIAQGSNLEGACLFRKERGF